MKPRTRIARIGKKKLARLGGKVPFSSIPRDPSSPRKAVRKLNPKRRKSEFARCYHSKERVAFVKTLACVACHSLLGENAHWDSGGTGRKSDYTHIVPLCGGWYRDKENYRLGCHMMMHHFGRDWLEKKYNLNLEEIAAETERAWLSIKGEEK